jgi:hypothetical protein
MNPNLEKLIELQKLDVDVAGHTKNLETVPRQIAVGAAELEAKKKELNDATAAIAELKKKRIRLEQDVQSENDHMGKVKAKLTDVKTNKEYSALLVEVDAVKVKVTAIEDQQLTIMEALESKEKELPGLKSRFAEEEAKFKQYQAQKEQEKKRVEEELAVAVARRDEMVKTIEPRWAAHYDKVRKKEPGEAVVQLADDTCQGCFQRVLPQRVIEIRQAQNIYECQHCLRILYCLPKPEEIAVPK